MRAVAPSPRGRRRTPRSGRWDRIVRAVASRYPSFLTGSSDERRKFLPGMMEPGPNRIHGNAFEGRDLVAAVTLDFEQDESGAPRFVHLGEDLGQEPLGFAALELLGGIARRR